MLSVSPLVGHDTSMELDPATASDNVAADSVFIEESSEGLPEPGSTTFEDSP